MFVGRRQHRLTIQRLDRPHVEMGGIEALCHLGGRTVEAAEGQQRHPRAIAAGTATHLRLADRQRLEVLGNLRAGTGARG